jgi:hypothetical protein
LELFAGVVFMIIWFGWVYSVAMAMYKLIPKKDKPGITYFKFSSVFATVYIFIVLCYGGYSITPDSFDQYGNVVWVLTTLHFYLIFALMYILYFAAKVLQYAIAGKPLGFSPKLFFGFWLFPIGIWYIQPAVQKVLDKYN